MQWAWSIYTLALVWKVYVKNCKKNCFFEKKLLFETKKFFGKKTYLEKILFGFFWRKKKIFTYGA